MSRKALQQAAFDEAGYADPAGKAEAERSGSNRPLVLANPSRRVPCGGLRPHFLDPDRLSDYIEPLYRAARGLCGSRADAEDLVQDTLVNVLRRPRLIRNHDEIGYLLRALRNTYSNHYRVIARREPPLPLFEEDAPTAPDTDLNARELMEAVASAPPLYRDAVIAVDLLGLSYREAAHALRTREATIATRLHRGRQHIARDLTDETASRPLTCWKGSSGSSV